MEPFNRCYMGFRSRHAYPMLYYMLTNTEFLQRKMAADLGIHFGKTVNDFVHWLIDLGYIQRTGTSVRGARNYQVVNPAGLIGFYAHFRKMQKIDTFVLGNSREEMINYFAEHGLIFCLTTALSFHMNYVLDPAINVYLPSEKENLLSDDLRKQIRGKVTVNVYEYDIPDSGLLTINSKKVTSKMRTIIDLYCDNKAFAAEELIKEFE